MKTLKLLSLLVVITAGHSSAANFINTFDTTPVLSGTGAGTGASTSGAWFVDRYAPGTFTNTSFLGNSVLDIGVKASDYNASQPFVNTQGRGYLMSNSGVGSSYSAQLYIPTSWNTGGSEISTGLWTVAKDGSDNVTGYPIIGFYSDGAGNSYFRGWDDNTGYVNFTSTAISFDSWNTVGIDFTADGFVYSVNGTDIYTDAAATGSVSVGNIILNTKNFGSSYDVYWDNLSTPSSTVAPVPEPSPKYVGLLLVAGTLLLLGTRKFGKIRA